MESWKSTEHLKHTQTCDNCIFRVIHGKKHGPLMNWPLVIRFFPNCNLENTPHNYNMTEDLVAPTPELVANLVVDLCLPSTSATPNFLEVLDAQ